MVFGQLQSHNTKWWNYSCVKPCLLSCWNHFILSFKKFWLFWLFGYHGNCHVTKKSITSTYDFRFSFEFAIEFYLLFQILRNFYGRFFQYLQTELMSIFLICLLSEEILTWILLWNMVTLLFASYSIKRYCYC